MVDQGTFVIPWCLIHILLRVDEMVTFDKVLIGFRVGKAWRRRGWRGHLSKWVLHINIEDWLNDLTEEDILANDWYEIPVPDDL